ncbi:MAG: diadenylate cyclase [Desulfobacterales bacterium]
MLLFDIPVPTWRDIIDILFLTFVVYQLYNWFRETRALRVLIGLAVLGAVYSVARFWGLFLVTLVFQVLWQVLLILLVILFQSEIKQVLERVSPLRYVQSRRRDFSGQLADEIARTAFDLAHEKTGALIIMARDANPTEYMHSGQEINAIPVPALIKSIFNRRGPAHDGAVLIIGGRLAQMGCILPLSERQDIPVEFGTRHRAAFGISEVTDAVCLVVSEERSEVTTIVNGHYAVWREPELLAAQLKQLLGMPEKIGHLSRNFFLSFLKRNWKPKLTAFVLVALAWMILASQQNVKTSITAPVRLMNLPRELVLVDNTPASVRLNLTGNRMFVDALKPQDIRVELDLSSLTAGVHKILLSRRDVDLPLGIAIDSVVPQQVEVTLKPSPGEGLRRPALPAPAATGP